MVSKKDILIRIKESIASIVPNAVVILYRSYARDEEKGESDIDILILLDKELGRYYSNIFDKRLTGDYDDFIDYKKDDVLALVKPAKEFAIRNFICIYIKFTTFNPKSKPDEIIDDLLQ